MSPSSVLLGQRLQLLLDPRLDLLAADRQHLRDRPVADHLPHDRFVHRAERVFGSAHLEEELIRVGHAVLHDPFDDGDVQVAGQHHRLVLEVLGRVPGAYGGLFGPETEFLLQLALHGDALHRFRERELRVEPGFRCPDEAPEPQHDADLLGLNLVEGGRGEQDGQQHGSPDPDEPRRYGWDAHT